MQARYDVWIGGIKEEYGSVVDYLVKHRLQWGKPDTLSLLRSSLDEPVINSRDSRMRMLSSSDTQALPQVVIAASLQANANDSRSPVATADRLAHFSINTPPELVSIIQNDWPYSVPPDIEHALIWTRLPIIDFTQVPSQITARLHQDGLWGFTGSSSPPPSPSTLPLCLPSLADWNVTMDKLIRSPKGTPEEDEMIKEVGREVGRFVRNRWEPAFWETAWFVNPPRLQSIPDLSHIHVFARKKSVEEITQHGRF